MASASSLGPADPRLAKVARLERLARLLDASIQVPGTQFRFGLDPLLGLIPGAGDLLSAMAAGWIVFESWRLGAGFGVLCRMSWNVALDMLLGAIPLLGDLLDFAMKPNQKNLGLLKEALGLTEM